MTIALAYDYQIFCIQPYGGISRYFFQIASRLQADDRFHVRIIAPLHCNKYLPSRSGFIIGRYLPSIPKTSKLREVLNRHLSNISLKVLKPDIIHETYYRWDGHNSKRSKRILTVHDMIHEKFPHFYPNDDTSFKKALAVKRADHIICVSENTKRDLIELLDVHPSKISVIYHGSSLNPEYGSQLFQQGRHTKPYILFVGSRGYYKNFGGFLRAYALSTRMQTDFDVVCFGNNHLSNGERSLIRDLKINEECIRLVSGDDRLLADCYLNAAAFCFPSFYEGFGIPLLEAMSCHCPIACSNTSCFTEIAGDAAEFFDPSSIESIADAIQRIVYSPLRTQELIQCGNERIKIFSWDRATAQTADIYCAFM